MKSGGCAILLLLALLFLLFENLVREFRPEKPVLLSGYMLGSTPRFRTSAPLKLVRHAVNVCEHQVHRGSEPRLH